MTNRQVFDRTANKQDERERKKESIDNKTRPFCQYLSRNLSSCLAARRNMVDIVKTILVCVRFLIALMIFLMVFDVAVSYLFIPPVECDRITNASTIV